MKFLNQERGYSLIEVVVAIIILGIVLISFSPLIIQANKIAYKNNEKLVTVNLADAMLERLKAGTFTYEDSIEDADINDYFVSYIQKYENNQKFPTSIKMNGKDYHVSYSASQSDETVHNALYSEKELNLIRVVVTVKSPDQKTKGTSEGYVALE